MSAGLKSPFTELAPAEEIEILRKMYQRERAARLAAEQIGEDASRRMYLSLEDLSSANDKLRAAVAVAQEASRAKGQFLANMSHEIRTPMNGVLGMMELLFHTELSARQRRFAETVRSSAEALLVVLNDVLDFSRLEVGKVELHLMDFDLRALIEDVAEMAAVRGQSKGLEVSCLVFHKVPSRVHGAPDRLRQVLGNLFTNGVKFTDKGEVILRVRLIEEEPTSVLLRFEITDSGDGINPDDLRRLFQPFTQVDGSHTRKHGGTGLGLAISKQIVELMGGSLGAVSEPGKGSTFWFTVKLGRASIEGTSVAPVVSETMNIRVLIVDDNTTNQTILQGLVHERGGHGDCANGGLAGLSMAREAAMRGEGYAVALIDAQMPEIDGWVTALRFKSEPSTAAIPLIMLTSLAEAGDGARALAVGFSGYLTKPVREHLLFKCISEVTGQKASVAQSPAAPSLVTRHTIAEAIAQSRHRVLIVEDNTINQLVTAAMLEHLGYQVDVAENGVEGLEAVARERYSLVLMDCQMPGMDGFATAAEIRRRERGKAHLPIVGLTAHAMLGDSERVIASGMDDYLSKPVRVDTLGKVLKRWMPSAMDQPKDSVAKGAVTEAKGQLPAALIQMQIESPEVAEEVVRVFLEQTPTQLSELRRRFAARDARALTGVAHSLKGSCLALGADSMVDICKALHVSGAESDWSPVASLLDELDREFDELRGVLTEQCPRAPS